MDDMFSAQESRFIRDDPGFPAAAACDLSAYMSESRLPFVWGHAARVAAVSVAIGAALEMHEGMLAKLECAALLHDIGKSLMNVDLLAKSVGEQTNADKKVLLTHPVLGARLSEKFIPDPDVARFIRFHHESFDGSGYPEGLSSQNIALESRIIAVVNAFDHALVDERNAKIAEFDVAREIVEGDSGSRLDPKIVGVFVQKVFPGVQELLEGLVWMSPVLLRQGMVLARDIVMEDGSRLFRKGTSLDGKKVDVLANNPAFARNLIRICITLDSLRDGHGGGALSGEEASKEKAHKKPLVVIIDDEQSVVNALWRELRAGGYRVKPFTNPIDALFFLKNDHNIRGDEEVHAMITDFNMPGIRGDNLLKMVQEELPGLPCLVLTGCATRENVVALTKAAKIVRILSKPWDKDDLLKTLSEVALQKHS